MKPMTNEYRELEIMRCADQIITTMAKWPVDIEVKIAALQTAGACLSNAVGQKAVMASLFNALNPPNGRR